MNFTCPRRTEQGMDREDGPFKMSGKNLDTWLQERSCSYCGSMHQDEFMRLIENGECTLTPTDKSYKVYVETASANPDQLEIRGSSNGIDPPSSGVEGNEWLRREFIDTTKVNTRGFTLDDNHWYLVQPHGPRTDDKFYFQHLSVEQRKRFVELLNLRKLKYHYPGYFYVRPFFVVPISG